MQKRQQQTTKRSQGKIDHTSALGKRIESFLVSDSPSVTVTKFLLMFIAMGGIVVIGATLPGLVKVIGIFLGKHKREMYSKKKIANSLAYLNREHLIEILGEKDGKTQVRLTNKGKKRLAEYSIDMIEIQKPAKWDGKWRVLMFDIPSKPKKYDSAREALRNKIKEIGFVQIQKSVWAYPYECEDELLFIAEAFKVQEYVEILTVERVLHEKVLRKKFPSLLSA